MGFVDRQKGLAAKHAGTLTEADLEKNELVKSFVSKQTAKAKSLIEEKTKELERLKAEYCDNAKRTLARGKTLTVIPPETFAGVDEQEKARMISVIYELLENRLPNLYLTEEGQDLRIYRKQGRFGRMRI